MLSPESNPQQDLPRRYFSSPEGSLAELSLPPIEAGDTALTVVNQIARMRDTITFEELRRRAHYLAGEPLKREPFGMWTYEHLVRLDPTPIDTPIGRIFDVYRFAVNREYGAPHIITATSFERDAIQYEGIPTLGREILHIHHGPYPLAEWPIRVAPGGAISLTRDLLRHVKARIRDAGEHQPCHFEDISRVLIGTSESLEYPGRAHPFSIVMVDRRGRESGEHPTVGWVDTIEERSHGEYLHASLHRRSAIIADRAVMIRNRGDVAFHLALTTVSVN